jgi:hypothetical protein
MSELKESFIIIKFFNSISLLALKIRVIDLIRDWTGEITARSDDLEFVSTEN